MPFQPPTSAQRSTRDLAPFLGIVYALDPEQIPEGSASDLRNVQLEDGRISQRYGYRNLAAAPGGFVKAWGLDYVAAFGTGQASIEEYIAVEDHGSGLLPYAINPSTGARTALGSSPTPLAAPAYGLQPGIKTIAFNNYSYTVSNSEASGSPNVFQHLIGTAGSWQALANPSPLPKPPTVIAYPGQTDSDTVIETMKWDDGSAALTSAAVVMAGPSDTWTSAAGDGYGNVKLVHNTGVTQETTDTVTITLNGAGQHGPGSQDFTYRDRIVIPIITVPISSGVEQLDPAVFEVTLTNASGQTFQAEINVVSFGDATSGYTYLLVCDFPAKSPRSAYASITTIEITFAIMRTTPGSGSGNVIVIRPVLLGNVNSVANDTGGNPVPLYLAVSTFNSVTGQESGLSICPPVSVKDTQGNSSTLWQQTPPLYARLKMFINSNSADSGTAQAGGASSITLRAGASSSNSFYNGMDVRITSGTGSGQVGTVSAYNGTTKVATMASAWATPPDNTSVYTVLNTNGFDHYNVYARAAKDSTWYKIAQIATGNSPTSGSPVHAGVTFDAAYDYQETWNEVLLNATAYTPGAAVFENVSCACPFNGGVVWGFKGGQSNIQFSALGNATSLYNNSDSAMLDPNNVGAPANMTMADNGADDPVALFAVNTSLIALGSKGVYASTGSTPTTMSPFVRLHKGLGCAGQFAACLWHDDLGNPAVAYLSKNGEGIYLAQQDPYFLNTTHFKVSELSVPVRGLVKDFLLNGSYANLQYVLMGIDERRDALWAICQNRAMVLRRTSMADQMRHWELYSYTVPNSANIQQISFTTNYGMRWIRSTGEVDENEWNSASSAYITGANSDAGSAQTPIYWQSRSFTGFNRRVDRMFVDRQNLTDTPTVTDICTRTPAGESQTLASGRYMVRFGWLAQGHTHQFKIALQDGSGHVKRIQWDELGPLSRRTLS